VGHDPVAGLEGGNPVSETVEPGGTPRRRRGEGGPTAAKSAAAAMDDLDAQEMAAARTDERDRADEFERYRERQSVSSQELAEHVRGGRRVEDGRMRQLWDWTNADVCRCQRDVLRRRFGDKVIGRELADDEGFDQNGNRIRVQGGIDTIVGASGDRFNDIVRELDGTKIFGTQRGLDVAEVQMLRTRYQSLVAQEKQAEILAQNQKRWAAQWVLFALFIAGFIVFLVAVYSG
jgi:hypothetical protein